jgi:hypothetical protein
MERPRLPFMENMLRDNIALAVGRAGQVTGSGEWDVIFCTDCPTDLNLFRRGGAMLFPKYVYVSGRRFPNLQPGAPNRKQIFEYIYAVLHSATYRQRYADFLATDYPRVPIVPDAQIFESLYALGKELISLHLTRETPPDSESVQLKIGGYTITKHAAQTLAIRNKIDEIIAATPPWQTAQDHSMPPGRDKANAAHNVIPSEARNLLCTNIPKADSSLHSE